MGWYCENDWETGQATIKTTRQQKGLTQQQFIGMDVEFTKKNATFAIRYE
jgi:hypothetical protein